jgi:hypothetical protein
MGALQGKLDRLRMGQQLAQILPDQGIQPLSWNVPRGASGRPVRVEVRLLAPTEAMGRAARA